MKPFVKIGLTQRVTWDENNKERRDCLDQQWSTLLAAYSFRAVPLSNQPGYFPAMAAELGLQGIILTGGNDLAAVKGGRDSAPERDQFEAEVIEHAAKHKLPLLGVCRGMQMLLAHSGIIPVPVKEHVRHDHAVEFLEPLDGYPFRSTVNSFHHYGFLKHQLAWPWRVLALATDGTVEAVRHESLPFYGIMWHPERGALDPAFSTLLAHLFSARQP